MKKSLTIQLDVGGEATRALVNDDRISQNTTVELLVEGRRFTQKSVAGWARTCRTLYIQNQLARFGV